MDARDAGEIGTRPAAVQGLITLGRALAPAPGEHGIGLMAYVILCYRDERIVDAASRADEALIGARLNATVATLVADDVISFAVSLLASTTSTTVRLLRGAPFVMDGPAVEAGLQLQRVYHANCANLDQALSIASRLADLEPGGVYEVRPAEAIQGRM